MSTAVSVDLTGLSLSELTDQAITLGGDFHLAREIGNVRHKKTWVKLIERLTAVQVEVLEDEPEVLEDEPAIKKSLEEINNFKQNNLQDKVLSHFLRGEVENYFGDLDDADTWAWAEKIVVIEKILQANPLYRRKPFEYEEQKGYFGKYFRFRPYGEEQWLELLRFPTLCDPFYPTLPLGIEPDYTYILSFPSLGHDVIDMDGDITLNNNNIIIYEDHCLETFFPVSIRDFSNESLTLAIGDKCKYKEFDEWLPGEVSGIFFPDIESIKLSKPKVKILDDLFIEFLKDGKRFFTVRDVADMAVGTISAPPEVPAPPPEKPPIVYPVPIQTPVAPWEKCNTPGSDRRECDKPVANTERGTGRQPTTGSICHVCEGTGNILDGIECLKCEGKGYLSLQDKVLFTAQEAVQLYVKKVSEQVRGSMATLPIEQVEIMAKELLACCLLAGSERSLGGISKAIDIAMKYSPATLPPFPWMKLKHRQAFLAVEKLDGYDFPFSNYYVGVLPYWQEVYLYLFPCCNDAEKFLNSFLICGDFAVLEVG